jgi:hypothetical protein
MKKIVLFLWPLLLWGCRSQEQKINAIDLQMTVERFDRDLYALKDDSACRPLPLLRERYAPFFEYYNAEIIAIGDSRNDLYCELLQRFLHHPVVDSAYRKVNEVYADDRPLNDELTAAFRHVRYYFPEASVPRVFTYVSGFNEALMLTDSAVGIGLDRFLGSDYALYGQLGKPNYIRYNMRPERAAPACLQAWLSGEYPENWGRENTLLSRMIYEGKLLYVLQQCMPKKPLHDLLGFTPEQLRWCEKNELPMWQHLIEQQLLYVTTPFVIQKYTGEAPFTVDFSQDAPGKAANWIGYRIVGRYVKRKGCALPELMAMQNTQQLLKEARYNP